MVRTHTLAALFATRAEADRASKALVEAGFRKDAISVITHNEVEEGDVDAGEGAAAGAIGGMAGGVLASIGLAAVPGIGWILAAGPIGSIIATGVVAGAAGALSGGMVAAMTETGIEEDDARIYAEAVRRGGTLVTVEVSEIDEVTAANALRRQGPVDLETTAARWRRDGWKAYDPKASPFVGRELSVEREHLMAARRHPDTPVTTPRSGRYLRAYPYEGPPAK